MSLRQHAMKFAAENPQLREAVMLLVAGIKYNQLLPGLETLFPDDKAQRVLREFWPAEGTAESMAEHAFGTLKTVKWDVVKMEEGEHTVVVDPWGSGNSPDAEEHYIQFEFPAEVSIQAKAQLPAPQLAKLVSLAGKGRPSAKQLLAFLRDPAVAKVMAQVLQKEFNDMMGQTDQEMFEDTIWDEIMGDVEMEGDAGPMDVTLKFESMLGQARVVPDGRGGLLMTIHGKIFLSGEATEGRNMPSFRMPPRHHAPGRV